MWKIITSVMLPLSLCLQGCSLLLNASNSEYACNVKEVSFYDDAASGFLADWPDMEGHSPDCHVIMTWDLLVSPETERCALIYIPKQSGSMAPRFCEVSPEEAFQRVEKGKVAIRLMEPIVYDPEYGLHWKVASMIEGLPDISEPSPVPEFIAVAQLWNGKMKRFDVDRLLVIYPRSDACEYAYDVADVDFRWVRRSGTTLFFKRLLYGITVPLDMVCAPVFIVMALF